MCGVLILAIIPELRILNVVIRMHVMEIGMKFQAQLMKLQMS